MNGVACLPTLDELREHRRDGDAAGTEGEICQRLDEQDAALARIVGDERDERFDGGSRHRGQIAVR